MNRVIHKGAFILEFSEDSKQVVVTKENLNVEFINLYDMSLVRRVCLHTPNMHSWETWGLKVFLVENGISVVCGSLKFPGKNPFTLSKVVKMQPESEVLHELIWRAFKNFKKTGGGDEKIFIDVVLNAIRAMPPHHYLEMQMVTIFMYIINDEHLISQYCQIVGIQTLVSYHSIIILIRLCPWYSNSIIGVINSISQYYTDNSKHVKIPDDQVKDIIGLVNRGSGIGNSFKRLLSSLLLTTQAEA